MIPLVIAAAVGVALLLSSCSSEEDEEKARPSDKPKCDSFEKFNPKHRMIDQSSYDAMNQIWKADVNQANAGNWHREARVFIGAAADLFKTSCTDPTVNKSSVQSYFSAVRSFFQDHYNKKASQSEDGMLVLIGGLAPAELAPDVIQDALNTMAKADESQMLFSQLLLACHRFNVEMDGLKGRFSRLDAGFPRFDKDSSKSDMWQVGSILETFDNCENIEVGRLTTNSSTIATCRTECPDRADIDQKLSDRQQTILNSLRQAYYYFTTGQGTRPEYAEFPVFVTDKNSCRSQNASFLPK